MGRPARAIVIALWGAAACSTPGEAEPPRPTATDTTFPQQTTEADDTGEEADGWCLQGFHVEPMTNLLVAGISDAEGDDLEEVWAYQTYTDARTGMVHTTLQTFGVQIDAWQPEAVMTLSGTVRGLADIDGDGLSDIVTSEPSTGQLHWFRGQDGTLLPTAWPMNYVVPNATWLDANADGLADQLTNDGGLQLHLGDGTGGFVLIDTLDTIVPDLIRPVHDHPQQLLLTRREGATETGGFSHFTAVVEVDPQGLMSEVLVSSNATVAASAALDLDGDTVTDVLGHLSSSPGVAMIAHGNAQTGSFDSPVPIDTNWSEIHASVVADFDGNGYLDYLWWNDNGETRLGTYDGQAWSDSVEVLNEGPLDIEWTPSWVPLFPHPRPVHLGDPVAYDLWDADFRSMPRNHVHWMVRPCAP